MKCWLVIFQYLWAVMWCNVEHRCVVPWRLWVWMCQLSLDWGSHHIHWRNIPGSWRPSQLEPGEMQGIARRSQSWQRDRQLQFSMETLHHHITMAMVYNVINGLYDMARSFCLHVFKCPWTLPIIRTVGVPVSAGPCRRRFTQISMRTSWKTARGTYACSLPWTGSKTTCTSSLRRAQQQHRLLRKSLHLRSHTKHSVDCGSTATTSTTRPRGRTSWTGPRSLACLDSACLESLGLCVWKVLNRPARSSGPGNLSVCIFTSKYQAPA